MYTEILEFFMENGVLLDRDQMEELKSVCTEGAAKKYIENHIKDDSIVKGIKSDGTLGYAYASDIPDSLTRQKDVKAVKRYLGAGEENIPKDRKPGTFSNLQLTKEFLHNNRNRISDLDQLKKMIMLKRSSQSDK